MIFDFFTLIQASKTQNSISEEVRVAILFDSSSQFFHQALKGYGNITNVCYKIYESDYNQIEKEIFTNNSALYRSNPDFVIIGFSTEKLYYSFIQSGDLDKKNFNLQIMEKFIDLYETLNSRIKTNIIFFNLSEGTPSIFGNFSNKIPGSYLYQIRELNLALMKFASEKRNFFILDINLLYHYYGRQLCFDPKFFVNSDIVFSFKILPEIAKNVNDIILSYKGKSKKCIILDLDNTLWGGVIGDDGIENIQIGSLGIGRAFSLFQMWLKQLKERGIILAVCSKNNEEIAKEPFLSHPEMILRLEDFVLFFANWKNKNENILNIQVALNLGYDSFVFLDDNPVEREIIKKQFPEMTVPDLPEDPSEFVPFLNSLNLFETVSFTDEDIIRTKLYQAESNRVQLRDTSLNEDEFLANLNMSAKIELLSNFNLPRVSQLFTRTNQFNLRTIRYTSSELMEMTASENHSCFAVTLKDKYGDYGLVSALVLKKNGQTLYIENWVMSCRVFKRGLEKFIFNHLLSFCIQNEINLLTGEYIPTPKNKVVEKLYQDLGFFNVNNKWVLEPFSATSLKNHIKNV